MNYKTYDYDGYQIYTIQTDKFKNCYIEVNFREDARIVNATKRNALVNLLTYTSNSYPTKREMRIKSEELYNLSFGGTISRIGYNLITSFGIDILNPKFVTEKNYLEDAISFLFDVLMNPHVHEKEFQERSFKIIKEQMKANIEHYKENPFSYASVESKKALFGDSISGVRLTGSLEELETITRQNIYEEYLKMMDSHCDIIIIGDMDMDDVVRQIKKYFYKPSIAVGEIPFTVENKIQKYHELEVESKYHQTQVLLYYQFENMSEREKNFISPIFTRILGDASMEDKLYKSLRIDASLCYSCGTTGNISDGYGVLIAKLSYKNAGLALEKMRECMNEMKQGKIENDFLESQKEKFLTDLNLRQDNIYGLIDNYYLHEIAGKPLYEDYIKEIPKITMEDIKEFGRKMQESFLYVLKEGDFNERN